MPDWDALSVRDRHDAMHQALRQQICLLDHPPGTRLSEEELARAFGTSRTPMRRVLARLEDEGLVVSKHGVGTIVTDANITELAQEYMLRVELTELTGRLNPVMPDAAFMAELDKLIARAKAMRTTGTARSFTQFDMDVFQTLLQLTANAPLRDVLERLYYKTKRIWLTTAIKAKMDLQEEFGIFQHELEAVQTALKSGDLRAAALLQRAHISMSFNRLQHINAVENVP